MDFHDANGPMGTCRAQITIIKPVGLDGGPELSFCLLEELLKQVID
jgi:hypothetical protein